MKQNQQIKRNSMALVFCIVLLLGQLLFFFPVETKAASQTPGDTLTVRVGYFGDTKDYRVKARLSRSRLESLGTSVYKYENVTRVGTVMGTVARGPSIRAVLDAAGIDTGSVQVINLRTTDGNKQENDWFVSLNMDEWVNNTRYYYPNLRANYECQNPEVLPLEGAAKGRKSVPAILAIESYSSKSAKETLEQSAMHTSDSYRFCTGQGVITEGKPTTDVSSMNSAKWIFGIDVTLYGSPSDATDLQLNLEDPKVKVGSKKKVMATVTGQELFGDKVQKKLTWSSSDPSIASVDQNGVVTIHKEGKVTITATTENGISRSIVINGVTKKTEEKKAAAKKAKPAKESKKKEVKKKVKAKVKGSHIREVVVGDAVMYERQAMASDAKALTAQQKDPMAVAYAAHGAFTCLTLGAALKILLYLKEV